MSLLILAGNFLISITTLIPKEKIILNAKYGQKPLFSKIKVGVPNKFVF